MPSSRKRRVLTFGETMGLATSHRPGSFLHEKSLDLSFGGAETNVAIGLRRLGVPVTWVSRLGDDSIGRLILRELAAEGVDTYAAIHPTAPTGLMLKERLSRSRTNVMYYRRDSAASLLGPGDIGPEMMREASILHTTGITPALSASAREATIHAMETAAGLGVTVSFDLNFRSKLWSAEQAAETFRTLVPLSSVVFAGIEEAQLLFPDLISPEELAAALVALGCGDAVIKQGPDGCTALAGGQLYQVPAVPVEAVDTVGAGDAFVAGYLSRAIDGCTPSECLGTAVATGALACLATGDWEGAPRLQDLLSLQESEPVSR
jgi:2-dehydro-3-deoxygluconokinase